MNFAKEQERAGDEALVKLKARIHYTALVGRFHRPAPGDAVKLDKALRLLEIDREQLAKDVATVTYNRLVPRWGRLAQDDAAELDRATARLGISPEQRAQDVGASQSETASSGERP